MPELLALEKVIFPQSHYININMMPFVLGDPESIPSEYQQYQPLIDACHVEAAEHGKVGYLTITETYVPKGVCQRRPGIHTDGHCCSQSDSRFPGPKNAAWGGGSWGGGSSYSAKRDKETIRKLVLPDEYAQAGLTSEMLRLLDQRYLRGAPPVTLEEDGNVIGNGTLHAQGIYMASNVAKTTRAWDYRVENGGWMGDCSTCPDLLKLLKKIKPVMFEANRLYWMTDRCPHECLPMPKSGTRQYFRLVTSAVDVWYTQHSTPNRLGVKPTAKMKHGNKFDPGNPEHQKQVNG